jgi:hypothetical protein
LRVCLRRWLFFWREPRQWILVITPFTSLVFMLLMMYAFARVTFLQVL